MMRQTHIKHKTIKYITDEHTQKCQTCSTMGGCVRQGSVLLQEMCHAFAGSSVRVCVDMTWDRQRERERERERERRTHDCCEVCFSNKLSAAMYNSDVQHGTAHICLSVHIVTCWVGTWWLITPEWLMIYDSWLLSCHAVSQTTHDQCSWRHQSVLWGESHIWQ